MKDGTCAFYLQVQFNAQSCRTTLSISADCEQDELCSRPGGVWGWEAAVASARREPRDMSLAAESGRDLPARALFTQRHEK